MKVVLFLVTTYLKILEQKDLNLSNLIFSSKLQEAIEAKEICIHPQLTKRLHFT